MCILFALLTLQCALERHTNLARQIVNLILVMQSSQLQIEIY